MKKFLLILFIISIASAWACTIGIINGSATTDGRPILWKSRGAGTNVQVFNEDSYTYQYVASGNSGSEYAWMGINEAGLAIGNAMISDLDRLPGNGDCMLHALQNFSTVDQFLTFLDSTNVSGRDTHTCYVIFDATGTALMLEVGFFEYWVYDTADTEFGFIIRTSFTIAGGGTPDNKYYLMNSVLTDLVQQGPISWQDISPYILRGFYDHDFELLPVPFPNNWNIDDPYGYLFSSYSNNSVANTSTALMQGVLPNEAPWLSTMWTALGVPVCSIAIPYWPVCSEIPVPAAGNPTVPLTDRALEVRQAVYNAAPSSGADSYMLSNNDNSGYWDTIIPFELEKFNLIEDLRSAWLDVSPPVEVLQSYQNSICNEAYELVMNWDLENTITADFDCDSNHGEIPFTVHFNNRSLHDPDYITWDFDSDGITDSVMTYNMGLGTDWTYEEAGSYSVTLKAYKDTLMSSITFDNYITASFPDTDYLAASIDTVVCDLEEPFEEAIYLYNIGDYPITINEYCFTELPDFPNPMGNVFDCCFEEPWSGAQLPLTINPGDSLLTYICPMMPVRNYWGETLVLMADLDTLMLPCLYDEELWQDADPNCVPERETLLKNYPNPFNPATSIFWQLPDTKQKVEIIIYNVRGQKTKSYTDLPSSGTLEWVGLNDSGDSVSSGIYYARLFADKKVEAIYKMLLLK